MSLIKKQSRASTENSTKVNKRSENGLRSGLIIAPNSPTIYWSDYETFGLSPQVDRAAQFAGVRTDMEFNIVGEPMMLYCKPSNDFLPAPAACVVTGITPQVCEKEGVCEADFIAAIHNELIKPGTCSIGYNSISFDDEYTRNLLYRNFKDPYAHEWKDGNSRFDLMNIARALSVLRPDIDITWPVDDGKLSIRLSRLCEENGLMHENAHDALSDVLATIELAKLLRNASPAAFDFMFANRKKREVAKLLSLSNPKPVVHVVSFYGGPNYISILYPVAINPNNSNAIICCQLDKPLDDLTDLQFDLDGDLSKQLRDLPLVAVQINKCPTILPMAVLREEDADRLSLDMGNIAQQIEIIKSNKELPSKVSQAFGAMSFPELTDVDQMIYSGGFFSPNDRRTMDQLVKIPICDIRPDEFSFEDSRLNEMLFRYRARNAFNSLNDQEKQRWNEYRKNKLTSTESNQRTFSEFNEELAELGGDDPLIGPLREFADGLKKQLLK